MEYIIIILIIVLYTIIAIKKDSIINVGVIINEALIKFCVGDGFQTSRIQAPNSMRDVKDAVPYEHKKITLIKL